MRSIRLQMTTCLLALALLSASCGNSDDATATGNPAEPPTTEATQTSAPTSTLPSIPEGAVALGELQIVGVEFGDSGFVTIENRRAVAADVHGIYIYQFPQYVDLGDEVPGGVIPAGATAEIPASAVGGLNAEGGEAALYANNADFGSPDNILAYVQWGTGGTQAEVATAANIWASPEIAVTPDPAYNDIVLNGDPADPENWS